MSDQEWGRGCPLDPANPAFYIEDYSKRGRALKADYARLPDERAEEYWSRVRKEIIETK